MHVEMCKKSSFLTKPVMHIFKSLGCNGSLWCGPFLYIGDNSLIKQVSKRNKKSVFRKFLLQAETTLWQFKSPSHSKELEILDISITEGIEQTKKCKRHRPYT